MKLTHYFLKVSVVLTCLVSISSADAFKNNFQSNLNQKSIDVLTKDLGALVGGGSFHTGKALGFPIGFDVGAHVPAMKLDDDNAILQDDGSSAYAQFAQLEVGLPFKMNVIGRGGKIEDATIVGGGLRYGILKPTLPLMPALSIAGLYNKVSHDYFDANVVSANLSLSVDIPFIRPYIGAGYDWSNLEVSQDAYLGAPGNAVANLDAKETGYRAEVGVNISVIPFTYITLAAGKANGQNTYHLGLGASF